MRRLGRVAIVGVGLIGGSLAIALRRAGVVTTLVAADRDLQALERAMALGVIDEGAESVSEAARGADLVIIALPVRAIGPALHDIGMAAESHAVITDVGSTKGEVVRIARQELRERFPRFVPG
ncbi:MAG TPA: prephenate dehydrogenase/arogenate dehydrogenase family protein, partial [Usitatibacter sp.]|nr:prephenate dehydrogenase/arogenate dehydrogenase family protein [Usitatibacter sp.]